MKMSRLTRLTITSMMAVSGSSTQPSCTVSPPIWNQLKLNTCRVVSPVAPCSSVCANAHSASRKENAIVPMVIAAANRRCGRVVSAIAAAAARGSAGISQRF